MKEFLAFKKKEYSKAFECSYKCRIKGYLGHTVPPSSGTEGLGVEQDYQKAANGTAEQNRGLS